MIRRVYIGLWTIGVRACRMGGNDAAAIKHTGLRGCSNRGLAVVLRGEQCTIVAGSLFVLTLQSGWRRALFSCRSLFRRRGLCGDAAGATVITGTIDSSIVVNDGGVVRVVDDRSAY